MAKLLYQIWLTLYICIVRFALLIVPFRHNEPQSQPSFAILADIIFGTKHNGYCSEI